MQKYGRLAKSVLLGYLCFSFEAPALAQSVVVSSGKEVIDSANITNAGSLKVSAGATAIIDFGQSATINLSGNIDNSGSIYAISSNPSVKTVNFNALNIFNHSGALLTTMVPAGLGINSVQNLSLSLNAINNIINAGTIGSAGNLSMIAGNSITNSAVATAAQNINLQSGLAGLINTGTISSIAGNINISNLASQNLLINNVNGTLQAMLGSINATTLASDSLKPNLSIMGGNVLSKELNISTQGTASLSPEVLTGVLNVSACDLHVDTNTANLQLGSMNITGDPTFFNPGGAIQITGSMSFPGSNLAIIAGTNITTTANNISISTSGVSTTFNGGNILMVAGANITTSGGTGGNTTSVPGDTAVTISGGTSAGGFIDLTGGGSNNITTINAQGGTAFNGGNVTLVAYGGTGTNAGNITLPSSSSISTGTTATTSTPTNGNVLIIGAGAISVGTIDTVTVPFAGQTNTGGINNGLVNIFSANPAMIQSPNLSNTPASINTLVGQSYIGQTFVQVSDATGISAGSYTLNSTGANAENITVGSLSGNILTLSNPLQQNHFASENIMVSASSLVTFSGFANPTFQSAGAYGPGALQAGTITAGSITAGANVVIATTGTVNLNGSVTLMQNPLPPTSYNNTPVAQISGAQINVASGITVSSAISGCSFCQDQLNLYTPSLTNNGTISGTFVNVNNTTGSVLSLVNNGTISGINPGTTAGNPWVNIQSGGGISFSGTGNVSVPGLAVISVSAADNSSINFINNTLFQTGAGGLVTLSAQGASGSINLQTGVSLTFSPAVQGFGGPIVSISTPTINLANNSVIYGLQSNMIFTSGALTQSPQPLTISVAANGSAQIFASTTSNIVLRPTDGQNIHFTSTGAGASLAFTGGALLYLFTGTNQSSGIAGTILTDGTISVSAGTNFQAVDPNGGITGIAFQPYVGLATNFNANPKAYTLFGDYTYPQVLLLMAPIAQTGLFQSLSTYTQGANVAPGATDLTQKSSYVINTAARFTIQAGKQMGFQVTAGAFSQNPDHSVNVPPTEAEIDYALQQAVRYGNVMDMVVGNECIVGGTSPGPSTTSLIQAINYAQVQRNNTTSYTATTLPITTRQTYGVLSGVTSYQSTVDLLNGCMNCQATYGLLTANFEGTNDHVYADVYPYYDGTNSAGGVAANSIASYLVPQGTATTQITSINAANFQTLVTAAGTPALPAPPPAPPPLIVGIQADLNGTLSAFSTASITPHLRVAETGWATASTQSNNTQTTSLPNNAPQAQPQLASWYYPDMQSWSYSNKATYSLGYQIRVQGYFEAYDEPWKFSSTPFQGGEPNFGIWTASGTTTTSSTSPASALEQYQLTGIAQKYNLPVLNQTSGPFSGGSLAAAKPVQLTSLDLTNSSTVATILGLQRTGDLGGSLVVNGGTVIGGTLNLKTTNIPSSLTAFNIPSNVLIAFNGLTAAKPIVVNITGASSSNRVVINGIASFTGAGTAPIININSNQNSTVLTTGVQGYLMSAGSLTITGNGNMAINAPVLTNGNLSLTSTAGAGPGNISVNNYMSVGATGAIAITAGGNLTTGSLYGGAVGGGNNITLSANGSYVLQPFGVLLAANGISITTTGTQNYGNGAVLSFGVGDVNLISGGTLTGGIVQASAGNLTLTAQTGDLTSSSISTIMGNVNLNATVGKINVNGLVSTSNGNVGLQAAQDININSSVAAFNGSFTANSTTGSVTQAPFQLIFAGGPLSLTGNQNVSSNGTLFAGKDITLTATNGTLTTGLFQLVQSTNGNVNLMSKGNMTLNSLVFASGTVGANATNGSVAINQLVFAGTGITITASGPVLSGTNGTLLTLKGGIGVTGSSVDLSGLVNALQGNVNITGTGGGVAASSIYAIAGSLNITANSGGPLRVKPFSVLLALGPTANITLLQNGNAAGDNIVLEQFAVVEAIALNGGNGNVTFSAGAGPTQIAGNQPANVLTFTSGTGKIFFGNPVFNPGITANGLPSVLLGQGANITFFINPMHGSGNQAIQLTSGNVIIADPPVGLPYAQQVRPTPQPVLTHPSLAGSSSNSTGSTGRMLIAVPSVQNITTTSLLDTMPVRRGVTSPQPAQLTDSSEAQQNEPETFRPIAAYSPSIAAGLTMANLQLRKTPSMHVRHLPSTSVKQERENCFNLYHGDVLINAVQKSTVNAGGCVVEIKPGSIVLVTREEHVTRVRTLRDNTNNDVLAICEGRKVRVASGQEVIFGEDNASIVRSIANDRVGRRRTELLGASDSIFCSDVSIVHLMQTSEVLTRLRHSKTPEDRDIVGKVLKMAAAIQQVTTNRGPYQSKDK